MSKESKSTGQNNDMTWRDREGVLHLSPLEYERLSQNPIEKDEIYVLTKEEHQVGPFGPMHRCHLTQEETEAGKESLARNPEGFDGTGRTLIVGFNPYIYKYGDHPKAWCAYCHRFVSDECQEWLDAGCQK